MSAEQEAYHALSAYTLELGDAGFIHQHVVDAFALQQANEKSKAIQVTFALVGLYLLIEKGFTGREVQRAHMRLAKRKRTWPVFVLPFDRGSMTAKDVMVAPEGPERDAAIHAWCASVWAAFAKNRETIADLLRLHGMI
ncbi:MAG: DUF5946 family protein [Thermoanaerobaculia bacterium]